MSEILIHTSDRTLFKKCRMQWHFASPLRMNLEPVRAKQPLTFGTLWHQSLEAYYDPNPASPLYNLAERRALALETFKAELDAWRLSLGIDIDVEEEAEYGEHLQLGIGMLEHYFDWAPRAPNYPDTDYRVIWVERHYTLPMPEVRGPDGEDVFYSFKPDALLQNIHDGRYWLMEDKTASALPSDTEYLLLDEQCGSYIWGIHEVDDIQVEGVLYNIARKKVPPDIKPLQNGRFSTDKRQDIPYERALKQLVDAGANPDHYRDWLEHLRGKGEKYFHRELVRRSKAEMEAQHESIIMEVEDMLSNPRIYRNPNSFNCGGCAFVSPCISYYEGGDVETILSGNYNKRKEQHLV